MSVMPGSFTPLPASEPNDALFDIPDHDFTAFEHKETAGSKTLAQRHLLTQLTSLVYILAAYQFVKYCHLACFPPLAAHVLVQWLLQISELGESSSSPTILFNDVINLQQQQAEAAGLVFDRSNFVKLWLQRLLRSIYYKFVAVVLWHALFIAWLQLVGSPDELLLLINGLWFCVTFLGESVPVNYSADDPWFLRWWKLGIVELILTDCFILVLQLTLYQSVYEQSTSLPKGIRLNEDEVHILRLHGAGSGESLPVDGEGIPTILKVRLFQAFGEDL